MQPDEVIWSIINHGHCSFKTKVASERTFCQNPYNVTGLCIRSACPLANSRYATIRVSVCILKPFIVISSYFTNILLQFEKEEAGICYLYTKTVERAHTPKHLWERLRLPANYAKALEVVSNELEYFPKYLQHRNKQRLTKIHHMIIRMRKLKLKAKPKLTSVSPVVEKRERKKEAKALKAAALEKSIENELLERLKMVSEGEIYNYPEREYASAVNKAANNYDKEVLEEEDGGEEELEEEEEEEEDEQEDYAVEYVEGPDGIEDDSDDDGDGMEGQAKQPKTDEDLLELYASLHAKRKVAAISKSKKGKKEENEPSRKSLRHKAKVEVEYEEEDEDLVHRTRVEAEAVDKMQFNF